MSTRLKIGERVTLAATGEFYPGVDCVVLDVDPMGSWTAVQAIYPDIRLCKIGFFYRGDGVYVMYNYQYCEN